MTAARRIVLTCDSRDCRREFTRYGTAEDVRQAATGDGWTSAQLRNGRGRALDFCPTHSRPQTERRPDLGASQANFESGRPQHPRE